MKKGTITPRPQDNSQATLAPILKSEDGLIDFSRTATEAWNRLRGFQPWPGAFTRFRGKMLHVHEAVPAPEVAVVAAGHFADREMIVCCSALLTALRSKFMNCRWKARSG